MYCYFVRGAITLQVGEFGGLIRQEILEYKYINLDAFGVGLSYRLPGDVSISLLGAYGTVALAHQWTEAKGQQAGSGFGANISIDKEWLIAKKWAVRAGPQAYLFKANNTLSPGAKDFIFSTISIHLSLLYYFYSPLNVS